MVTVAVIGANGKQGFEFVQALKKIENVQLVGCVVNRTVSDALRQIGVEIFEKGDLDSLLKKHKIDVAFVSVPHDEHHAITTKLLQAGALVVKEKPLALTVEQAKGYNSNVYTTVQRTVMPAFLKAKESLEKIGAIESFTYTYHFALAQVTSGWRADPVKAGGGVVIDMGYHIIDIVQFFFGRPQDVKAEMGYAFDEMKEKKLEDSAKIRFVYPTFSGSIDLDRHAMSREEKFVIHGAKGKITVTPTSFEIQLDDTSETQMFTESKQDIIKNMFTYVLDSKNKEALQRDFLRNIDDVRIIEQMYASRETR